MKRKEIRNYFYKIFVVFTVASSVAAKEKVMDRIEVKINSDIITQSEIDSSYERAQESMRVSRSEIRDKLVIDILIKDKLEKIGRATTDKNIDVIEKKVINEVLEKNKLTQEELTAHLAEKGKTFEQYKHELRDELRSNSNQENFIGYVIRPKLREIDEKKIVSEYNKKYSKKNNVVYHLAVILVRFTNENKEAKRELIKKIRHELTNENFAEYAQKYSESATSDMGGDMGNMTLTDLHEQIQNAVKDLKPDEISPIIEVQKSFYIFRVIDRTIAEGKEKKLATNINDIDATSRNSIAQELQQHEISESIKSWVEEAKERAYIEIIPTQ